MRAKRGFGNKEKERYFFVSSFQYLLQGQAVTCVPTSALKPTTHFLPTEKKHVFLSKKRERTHMSISYMGKVWDSILTRVWCHHKKCKIMMWHESLNFWSRSPKRCGPKKSELRSRHQFHLLPFSSYTISAFKMSSAEMESLMVGLSPPWTQKTLSSMTAVMVRKSKI